MAEVCVDCGSPRTAQGAIVHDAGCKFFGRHIGGPGRTKEHETAWSKMAPHCHYRDTEIGRLAATKTPGKPAQWVVRFKGIAISKQRHNEVAEAIDEAEAFYRSKTGQ